MKNAHVPIVNHTKWEFPLEIFQCQSDPDLSELRPHVPIAFSRRLQLLLAKCHWPLQMSPTSSHRFSEQDGNQWKSSRNSNKRNAPSRIVESIKFGRSVSDESVAIGYLPAHYQLRLSMLLTSKSESVVALEVLRLQR